MYVTLGASLVVSVAAFAAPRAAQTPETVECIAAHVAGQKERAAGAFAAARASLLSCSRAACPPLVQKDCSALLAELEAAQPSVVVEAIDDHGRASLAPTVFVDGASRGPVSALAIPLDPGEHTVRAVWPDGAAAEDRIVLREGQRRTQITLRLASREEAPIVRRAPVPNVAWVLFGGAAASTLTGAVLGAMAVGQSDELEGSCGRSKTCDPSDVDRMRTLAIASDVALGVGVAAAALGLVVVLTRGTTAQAAPRAGGGSIIVRF